MWLVCRQERLGRSTSRTGREVSHVLDRLDSLRLDKGKGKSPPAARDTPHLHRPSSISAPEALGDSRSPSWAKRKPRLGSTGKDVGA